LKVLEMLMDKEDLSEGLAQGALQVTPRAILYVIYLTEFNTLAFVYLPHRK
jgi:hypothetical protein